jgi:omega-hydroxy-beta-dihydromenaquinone-9 sulfotransferase
VAGPFFIAGTGRCGTSQLRAVLGEHPEVHGLEWETRFVTDPGGFEDLARAVTVAYSPFHAADALERLAFLLNERLAGHTLECFRGWGLADELGPERWRAACDRLWRQLTWYEYDEMVPPLSDRQGRWQYAPGEPRARRRVVARYFPDRAELIAILREFTADLFGGAARRAGKRTWCEKTPFNLLSVPFLHELFPEATVVAIMRHPCAVAASHLDQPWAPSTLEGVLGWLEPVYRRWLAQRPALLDDPRYVEVKAEDLAAGWPGSRQALFGRLGLPDAGTASAFEPSQLSRRDAQLDDAQRREVAGRLGWAATALGYPAGRGRSGDRRGNSLRAG